jgi:hypothetical protein
MLQFDDSVFWVEPMSLISGHFLMSLMRSFSAAFPIMICQGFRWVQGAPASHRQGGMEKISSIGKMPVPLISRALMRCRKKTGPLGPTGRLITQMGFA